MQTPPLHTIDDVIQVLENIIDTSIQENDPMGYFAALYKKVTVKVKEGIAEGFFEDGPRMEQLDIVFAKRYLDAYFAYRRQELTTLSWEKAFVMTKRFWPTVLQHLLMGINAHINLDLGIAATEIMKGKNLDELKTDFDRINEILSSLVMVVQNNLAQIWPPLKKILQKTGQMDDFLIDFSMELARDGAWEFAQSIAGKSGDELDQLIKARDQKVADKSKIISDPGFVINIILGVIRLGERGSVAKKIAKLEAL